MKSENYKFKKYAILIILLITLSISCLIIHNISHFRDLYKSHPAHSKDSPNLSLVYDDYDVILIEDGYINETIFIMEHANITLTNTTVNDSIYLFNTGILNIQQDSSITGNIIISDLSVVNVYNSTIEENIECRDFSSLSIFSSKTDSTTIWKFDSANLNITNSSFFQLNEFGIDGQIQVLNSLINFVSLNGLSSSRVYINNSNVSFLNDLAKPLNYITGPMPALLSISDENIIYQTAERSVKLTWIGWDSPIIDGYLNITFQILIDGQFQYEINGSGFHKNYIGSLPINFTSTGIHNISLVSIDSFRNNFTSTITIEITEYPSFKWNIFGFGVSLLIIIVVLFIILLRHQQNRGYFSSLGIIFKNELAKSKFKIIVFMGIGILPGIILSLIYRMINRILGSISIDQIRNITNIFLVFYFLYFGLAFSITFASMSIIGEKSSGSLSWFFSKPVRRWEFLWGKFLAYIFIVIIIMLPSSISFALSGILYVDKIYFNDLFSIGGYIFLIGIITLIPLLAIGFLCSTLFKKMGLAIFIPMLLFAIVPTLVSFLPLLVRHEWPLLFTYSYYYEQLGRIWIANSTAGLSSVTGPFSEILGFTITPIKLTLTGIVLILSTITIVCLVISTLYFQKIDIP
ncbi:MAG: ABC transporter permease [Promethearchaeota archaeon]